MPMLLPELIRVLDLEPHAGALNMAIDEVLLLGATVPILRSYRWLSPAVSFGYFGKVSEAELLWPGRELVRRWTGGGVVPHGADFTYTLIVPRGYALAAMTPVSSYAAIHERIAGLLASDLREKVQLAAAAGQKLSNACFENAVQHDVLAGSEKVAGAAQRRTRQGLLHQGSIQVSGLSESFGERLASRLSEKTSVRTLLASELEAAEELAARKYATLDWLRRC